MLIFSASMNFNERLVNSIEKLSKGLLSKFQLILTFFRRCTTRLKIILLLRFSLTFQQTTHKPLNIEKYDEHYY